MKEWLKKHSIKIISAISLFLISAKPQVIYAASRFVDRADSSIYHGIRNRSGVDEVITTVSAVIDWGADIVGGLLAGLIMLLANSLYVIMANMGMTLDAIIYGRVFNASYMTEGVAMFTYDTTNGNVYGIVSMVIFSVLSSIVFFVALVRLMTVVTGFIYTNGGPKKREELKEQITKFIMAMLSIALAPALIDLAIYVRDLCLYQVGMLGNSLVSDMIMGGYGDTFSAIDMEGKNAAAVFFATESDYSITNQFREIATDGNFLNACMYLGSLVLTIYFAFTYIGAALSMVALVGFLPIAIVYDIFEKGMLGSWLKSMFGILMIPIIDSTLLLVPIMIGGISSNIIAEDVVPVMPFIQFIACATIIPARAYVRQLLGIRGNMGMEMAGLGTAAMGIKAVAGLGKNIQGMIDRSNEEKKGIQEDEDAARAYEAKAETLNANSAMKEEAAAAILNQGDNTFMETMTDDELEGLTSSQRAMARTDNLEQGIGRSNEYAGELQATMDDHLTKEQELDGKIRETDAQIAALQTHKATLDAKDPANRETLRELDQKIAGQREIRNDYVTEKAKHTAIRMNAGEERKRVLQSAREASGVLSSMQSENERMNATRDAERLDRLATIENFDSPAFRNITAERKAQLYDERAMVREEQRQKAVNRQSIGMGLTAAVGSAAGIMAGPVGPMFAGQAAEAVGEMGARSARGIMEKRSRAFADADADTAFSYPGFGQLKETPDPVSVNRDRYPEAGNVKGIGASYEASDIRTGYDSTKSDIPPGENAAIADAIFSDMWNDASDTYKKSLNPQVQSCMADVYGAAKTYFTKDKLSKDTEELINEYALKAAKEPYEREAQQEIDHKDPNYQLKFQAAVERKISADKNFDQRVERYREDAKSNYYKFWDAAVNKRTQKFLNEQSSAFTTALFDRMERDGYVDKFYEERRINGIDPALDAYNVRNNIGKNKDSAIFVSFIKTNLKAKNLLPKEGGAAEYGKE